MGRLSARVRKLERARLVTATCPRCGKWEFTGLDIRFEADPPGPGHPCSLCGRNEPRVVTIVEVDGNRQRVTPGAAS